MYHHQKVKEGTLQNNPSQSDILLQYYIIITDVFTCKEHFAIVAGHGCTFDFILQC